MHYGVVMFSTHYAIRPDELGRAVEIYQQAIKRFCIQDA